jgi:hypothetical protein
MIREKLDAARSEIVSTTKAAIEKETACAWGARAIASFEKFKATRDLNWLAVAVEYEHEALEHAAASDAATFATIQSELESLKKVAMTGIGPIL